MILEVDNKGAVDIANNWSVSSRTHQHKVVLCPRNERARIHQNCVDSVESYQTKLKMTQ